MANRSASTVLLGLILLGVGVIAGLLIASRPGGSAPPPTEVETTPPSSDADDLAERVAVLEDWVAEARHEVGLLREEVEPVEELLEVFRAMKPRLEGMREKANQVAAVATLRNIVAAQAQMQASAKIDQDNDGVGEYGGFLELSGAQPGRMAYLLVPPVLSGRFRALSEHGEVGRAGYLFRVYLPDADGIGIGEPHAGFAKDDGVDAALAERFWCAYAWPVEKGAPTSPTYFVNQEGYVFESDDAGYAGTGGGPAADAAYAGEEGMRGPIADGMPGRDGHRWKRVP